MVIVTIINWKRKLIIGLACIFVLGAILFSFSCFTREEDPTIAPSGKLEDDVLNQPIKVQGEVDSES